jgi:hypothetical protein
LQQQRKVAVMPIDEKTRTELEAAAFRRLVEHLRSPASAAIASRTG